MFIEAKDGRVGEHLQFTSYEESTFSLVKLPDGTFEEWDIKYCREVEERKNSEQGESPTTAGNTGYKFADAHAAFVEEYPDAKFRFGRVEAGNFQSVFKAGFEASRLIA